jgi:chromosome segregation ATPase
MNGRSHKTTRPASGDGRLRVRWAIVASAMILCLTALPAFAQQPPERSERRSENLQDADRPQDREQPQSDLLTAERKRVLTMLLEQVHERQADVEAALREHPDGTEEGRALRAEFQALNERRHILELQRQDLSRVGQVEVRVETQEQPRPQRESDGQMDDLLRRQEELRQRAQELRADLRQAQQQQGPEQDRRQEELDRIEDQMRDVSQELADLQRQRQRAQYLAAVRAREQEQAMRERARPEGGAEPQVRERRELDERTAERMRQRQELDRMAQRMQTQFDQLQQQIEELREQAQQQQEQTGNEYQELRQNFGVLRDVMQGVGQQAGATYEDMEKRHAQESAAQKQNEDILRRQQELGARVAELEGQLKAAERRGGNEVTALRDELGRIHADLGQVQQRLGQIDSGKPQPTDDLRGQISSLRDQVRQLQEDVTKMRAVVDAMPSQTGRSTVGSAGYAWGW